MRILVCLLLGLISPALAVAADLPSPIVRTALDKSEVAPGQPALLTITVLVPTWLPVAPVFPGFEAPNLVVRSPEGSSYSTNERIGYDTWFGVERTYWLHPMTVGRYRLPSQAVTVTFADPETRAPVEFVARTDEFVFDAVLPEGAADLDPFVAATLLTLEQDIAGDPEQLEPGGSFTQTVTARVEGTSAVFLPPLIEPLVAEGIAVYPKEPVVTETAEDGILVGQRVESVTYVAEAGGRASLPSIQLRWFDLGAEQIETAEVTGVPIVSRGPWLRKALSWLLGVLSLGVLVGALSRRWGPIIQQWRDQRRRAYLASEASAFERANRALRARELGAAMPAIELWLSRTATASNTGNGRLGNALEALGAALYGGAPRVPSESQWLEAREALRDLRRGYLSAKRAAGARRALPPLNPEVGARNESR